MSEQSEGKLKLGAKVCTPVYININIDINFGNEWSPT